MRNAPWIPLALISTMFLSGTQEVFAGASPGLSRLLEGIPPERIETGILYDRVLPLSRVTERDGRPGSPPASAGEWIQMTDEMRRASLVEPAWPSAAALRARTAADGTFPVAILDVRYDRLRPDAIDTGALVVRGDRLAPGRGEALRQARAFAAAALPGRTYHGGRVEFRIDRNDYLTNGSLPNRIEADFDDGAGFVALPFGRAHEVRYASEGRKAVTLRATFEGGEVLEAGCFFDVLRLETPAPHDTLHVTASIPYLGGTASGDAYVYLAEGHAAIENPVIVVEGFDLANSMNWDELYALLNQEQLLETLRGAGFDAVVLNFANAIDYMQRNAYLVEELVAQVNAIAGPSSRPALIGASMGGVLCRFALADMENRGVDHKVRTYISFDGPQEGADIPLGIQYWVAFFADDAAEAAALLAALDSPAARQLLVYHHTEPAGSAGESDPLRAEFLADLAAAGDYPDLPRMVAIANGSGARQGQGFNAGDQIIRWEYDSFLVDVRGNVWAVPGATSGTIFHGLIDIIFVPEDEQIITVSGTKPYDNAPGGWRASMAQMDSTAAPYGDIIALHEHHDFIPTVSALDIDTEDLFYDVAGDAELLAHTPFDAVYFPVANEEHILVSEQTAAWVIAEVISGATDAPDSAPAAVALIRPPAPNPAPGAAIVRFAVPAAGPARLAAYDASGRRVAVILDERLDAGEHEARWEARDATGVRLASGVYFVRLEGRGFAAAQKIVVE